MKIYTKTGDTGTTGLFGGQRVAKTDQRLAAAGAIDELNSWIGAIQVQQKTTPRLKAPDMLKQLSTIQSDLFTIGSQLTTPASATKSVKALLPRLTNKAVTDLEDSIDAMTRKLPPLRKFILPGGSQISSTTHIARTVCRRAERQIVLLAKTVPVDPIILKYCNRLSDWLFTLARFYNAQLNQLEQIWK